MSEVLKRLKGKQGPNPSDSSASSRPSALKMPNSAQAQERVKFADQVDGRKELKRKAVEEKEAAKAKAKKDEEKANAKKVKEQE